MKKLHLLLILVATVALAGAGAFADHARWDASTYETTQPRVVHAPLSDSAFARLISRLSEPGGFFDSDNLISNETGYLHPLPRMMSLGVSGGAYIGVGPDQNYSYIASVRPEIAFMIDVRRDAGLQHLLYKDLFARARNRMEYLCLLLGKPVPADINSWGTRSLTMIVDHLDRTPASRDAYYATSTAVRKSLVAMAHEVSEQELNTIANVHSQFFASGLGLQYSSLNRRASRNYPSFRSLLLERDVNGDQVGYLSSEDRFQYVKSMHAKNLIVPVSGNLAGPHALRAIGTYLKEQRLVVSALYVSNVEYYLWRDQIFDLFAENVTALPRNSRSVIIRSVFDNTGYVRSANAFSEQLLGKMDDFVATFSARGYRTYGDVVTKGLVALRE